MKRNILFVIALTMIALNSNAQFKIIYQRFGGKWFVY
jgi:hypothetical protein